MSRKSPQRVLVISPHPDDESIGCGGTIRKHVVEGDRVEVIFLTSGEKGGHGLSVDATREIRQGEAGNAAKVLGVPHIEFWGQPDGALRGTAAVIQRLAGKINTFKPHRVYAPHELEMHPDHRSTVRLLRRALAEQNSHARPDVFLYEVWTPLTHMDEIVDISPFMTVKLAAIRTYRSQCKVMSFDAAIRGLNRYRGEMHSWPGGDYAEVFKRLQP